MTIANRAAARVQSTHNKATHAAWLFPGRTELALAVNWRQAAIEVMVDDLRVAREIEEVKDSTRIARLRLLSAQCSTALARCRSLAGVTGEGQTS